MSTALITGGSRGFGRALTSALLDRGWDVVIDGRDAASLQETADGLTATKPSGRLRAIPGDVTDAAHRRQLRDAVDQPDGLDLLVNNAGTLGPSPLPRIADLGPQQLRAVFEVNTVAPTALIRGLLPALRRARGTIVNITSDAAIEAYVGWGAYGASKAALERVSAILAAEEPELTVHAFDPGDMRTDMHQAAFPGEDIADRPTPEEAVPALLDLIGTTRGSGRHRGPDLVVPVGGLL